MREDRNGSQAANLNASITGPLTSQLPTLKRTLICAAWGHVRTRRLFRAQCAISNGRTPRRRLVVDAAPHKT